MDFTIINKWAVQKIASIFAMPYLNAGFEMWIDADNKKISYSDMKKRYLKNCIELMKKYIEYVENGDYKSQLLQNYDSYQSILSEYEIKDISKMSKENQRKFTEYISEVTSDLLNDKISEIEYYLKNE